MMEVVKPTQMDKSTFDGTKLNRNFCKLMDASRLTLTQIHRNTGIAIPTIKRIQSDPKANPTIAILLPLAELFGISVNQLIGNEPLPANLTGYIESRQFWQKIPVIQWEQAHNWPDKTIQDTCKQFITTDIDIGEAAFALRVEDENWGEFRKGSLLIVDPSTAVENGHYVIVYNQQSKHAMLKKIMRHDGVDYLKPPNPDFKVTEFDKHYSLVGVVVQVRMDMRNGNLR